MYPVPDSVPAGSAHLRGAGRASEKMKGESMNYRSSIGTAAAVAALVMTSMAAQAFDDAKYPDLSGQWVAVRLGVRGQPAFDPTKPWGLGQQAPLTPEYQKVL